MIHEINSSHRDFRKTFLVFHHRSDMALKRKRSSSVPRSLNGSYGEGDSSYQAAVFSSAESSDILRELDDEILFLPRERFQFKIFSKINVLPRDKAFYGDVQADGSCESIERLALD